jgi:hypothetical protein
LKTALPTLVLSIAVAAPTFLAAQGIASKAARVPSVRPLQVQNSYTFDARGLFLEPPFYTVGSSPVSVAIGDFNGDGKPDLAVVNQCGNDPTCSKYPSKSTVSILLGNGDGTFQKHLDYEAGQRATGIVAADFNGDGKLDIAVTNSNGVSILLGNGDGTFRPRTSYSVAPDANALVAGDFNGDGKLDIATANSCHVGNTCTGTGTVSVLMGNGDGTFRRHVDYSVGYFPDSITAADFNGDGNLDIAVSNNCSADYYFCPVGQDSVSILLGKGQGSFAAAVQYSTGPYPTCVTAADLNQDGKPDLLVVNVHGVGWGLAVFTGNGDGTFQAPVNYSVSPNAVWAVTGDFNGDEKTDVVVGGADRLDILMGNGDGTLQPHIDYGTLGGSVFVASGDLNGDGKPDLVIAEGYGDLVTVLLNNGDGTLHTRRAFGSGILGVIAGDFNGDGKPDLLSQTGYNQNSVGIFLGNGDGTFQTPITSNTATAPLSLTSGDLNRDGKLDLVTINYSTNSVGVLLGNGNGTFQPEADFATTPEPYAAVVGDFNNDGKPDLAVSTDCFTWKLCGLTGAVSILLGKGDGTFRTRYAFAVGNQPVSLAGADFNGDGNLDLAVANSNSGSVSILLGDGTGNFQPAVDYAANYPWWIAVGDFNGDGKPDIVTANVFGGSLSVLINNGDGTFAPYVDYIVPYYPQQIAVGDFNHDGQLDLAVTNGSATVLIFLGNGDGTFQLPLYYTAGSTTSGLAVADFDGDGKLDLAVSDTELNILLNTQIGH